MFAMDLSLIVPGREQNHLISSLQEYVDVLWILLYEKNGAIE